MDDKPEEIHDHGHWARFSHEFEEGPSGPARSYWDVFTTSGNSKLLTLCMHHRSDSDSVQAHVRSVLWGLNGAYANGRAAKAAEIKKALGDYRLHRRRQPGHEVMRPNAVNPTTQRLG